MKWKIILKLLYLVTLFAIATYQWNRDESQLIDSDPKIDTSTIQQAYHKA